MKSPSIVKRKPDKRSGVVTQSVRFWTMALPCLNYYYDLFYKDKVKIVPKNLGELFTAKGLAEGRRYISTTSALFSKSSATRWPRFK